MADSLLTLADLAIVNDQNAADYDISDLLDKAPVIAALAADNSSNGTVHKYVKETGAPVVGFRTVNDGRDLSSSTDTAVTINLQILDATHAVDQALANAYRRGPAAYVGRESERHLRAAFFKAEQQLFYGTTADGDTAGYDGINDTLDNYGLTQVIEANTSGSNLTSVYFIRTGENDAQVIAGDNGNGNIEVGETVTAERPGSVTGTYPAYYTPILAWLGFQMGSVWSVVRLCNIPDAGGTLLDDDLIYDALEIFPVGSEPSYIVMNRRSREQLRKSRTATNATGTPAPTPESAAGIPIITSDSISNAETLVPAS